MRWAESIRLKSRQRWQIEQPSQAFGQWFWIGLTSLVVVVLSIAAVFWIGDHPYGTNWDEANYINRAYRDVSIFKRDGIVGLLQALVQEDVSRPSAFRLLVLPLTLVLGPSPTLVRLVSLACLWLSLLFVYGAARRLAGATAGAFAATFLALCPIMLAASMRFYVDFPLHLAIAAMLYFLFSDWNQEQPRSRNWIGLGLALGLGGLAKPPFVFIAVPSLLLAFALSWFKVVLGPKPLALVKAAGLGILIMLPWWAFNFRAALSKSFRSGGFSRHSLGPKGSLVTLMEWLNVVAQSMLGPALALLTLAILGTLLVQLLLKQDPLNRTQATAIAVCLAGALPMLLLAAVGTNQNPRLVSPCLVPFAVTIGVIATATGWTSMKWRAALATAIIGCQLAVMISPSGGSPRYQEGDAAAQSLLWGNPTTTVQRSEQWDWSKLKTLCDTHQLQKARIAYLGSGDNLSPTQIIYAWAVQNQSVSVTELWRYEQGKLNWDKIMKAIDSKNVVITVPAFTQPSADQNNLTTYQRFGLMDNQHNVELVERLRNDSSWSGPMQIEMGRFEPTPIFVFLRKTP